jgi:hypothetical protein
MKCEAHISRTDKIAIGNRRADKIAKAAVLVRESVREPYVNIVNTKAGIVSLIDLQQQTNKKVDSEGLWYNPTTGRPVASSGIYVTLSEMYLINRL